ncbi:aldo/keto reductase [Gillisia sp. M10.2A]|uniref:Aldo/keto reductase n=1 Tax=Gillisia lutea TaxID=2909668 RepID=A0ABS9EG55_9FLAO|nr:aldo/keto reductase [Gillisia lutea]MCF4101862.1 aldo/keto reductase [Gillisia lutea]
MSNKKLKLKNDLALGGVAMGNGFEVVSDKRAQQTLETAWDSGIRHFDTSPWYGLGLSERRFGHFLHNKNREDYVLSTKVGRLFTATNNIPKTQWVKPSPFDYKYDYSASGVRRSIEDSLQRMGVESIDYVFIHDLSPDNDDLGEDWKSYFDTAAKGAMPELSKMRDEGLIKGWGLGVNTIDPILKTIEVADPDLFLSAIQYSMVKHKDSIDRLFPVIEKHEIPLIVAAPFNAGLLAGQGRFNYQGQMPAEIKERYQEIKNIAEAHKVDLSKASMQFSAAPDCVDTLLTGASRPSQVKENVNFKEVQIPTDFWAELKSEGLIDKRAAEPK